LSFDPSEFCVSQIAVAALVEVKKTLLFPTLSAFPISVHKMHMYVVGPQLLTSSINFAQIEFGMHMTILPAHAHCIFMVITVLQEALSCLLSAS